MCLVAEYTTMSAPSSSGRWYIGVENTLSTISRAPALCDSSATAWMSTRSSIGFDGLSRKVTVAGRDNALSHAPRSVPFTNSISTPQRGSSFETM